MQKHSTTARRLERSLARIIERLRFCAFRTTQSETSTLYLGVTVFRPYSTQLKLDHESWRAALPLDSGVRGHHFLLIQGPLRERGFTPNDGEKRIRFKSYPRFEYLDLVLDAAQKISPDSVGQGLFEVGLWVYGGFRETLVGNAIFSVAGLDFQQVLRLCPRAFAAVNVHSDVIIHHLDEKSAHIELKDLWNFTHLAAGIFRGGMDACGVKPTRFDFLEHGPGHLEFKLEWTKESDVP